MSKSKRKKNEESKRRFEAIKDLMSTFAMSTVAVVAAVTLIPASPKAEIIKAIALNEKVVYQVNITDEENALDLDTLFVVLENQLEFYEQPISLGENSGYFDSLEYNTEYRLSVYGNKGFGQERLDTQLVTTSDKVGGTILSVTPETFDFSTNYLVDVSINDPNLEYSSVTLYYGYSFGHDTELFYSSVPVTSSFMSIELSDIHTSELIHIYLEGITEDGTEVLDEIWVTPPFELYSSIYIDYINNNRIGFFVYTDMNVDEISYVMNIYQNEELLRTDKISLEDSDFESSDFEIDDLLPNTTYIFECIATYINPLTLREEEMIIYTDEVTTIAEYTYSYSTETFDEYIEVTIILDDPNNQFQIAYYESYDTTDIHDVFLTGNSYFFIDNGNDKSITFSIFIPLTSSYQITIGIRSEFNHLINETIDIIIFE